MLKERAHGFNLKSATNPTIHAMANGKWQKKHVGVHGVVCRSGRECGIATPFNDKVVEIVKQAESHRTATVFGNLERFDEIIVQAK